MPPVFFPVFLFLFSIYAPLNAAKFDLSKYHVTHTIITDKSSNLSSIAERIRPNNNYSIYKISQLLFQLNPQAFYKASMDHLKSNSSLMIPQINYDELLKESYQSKQNKETKIDLPKPLISNETASKELIKQEDVDKQEASILPASTLLKSTSFNSSSLNSDSLNSSTLNKRISHDNLNDTKKAINTNQCLQSRQKLFRNKTELPASTLTNIYADEVSKDNKDIVKFIGKVDIQQNNNRIQSNIATYNIKQELFTAHESVLFSHADMHISGDKLSYYSEHKNGSIKNANYLLLTHQFQGQAKEIQFSPQQSIFSQASFSSCPKDNETWLIKSSKISLHPNDNYGEGKNVTFYIKKLPVFYFPYIQFPLGDKRMTGLLFPGLGYSSETGFQLSTPFYWNIAPHIDATITPTIMSNRGVFFNHELRHLSQKTNTEIHLNHIYDAEYDQVRNLAEIDKYGAVLDQQRQSFRLIHHHQIASKWKAVLDYRYASDNYFNGDFEKFSIANDENHLNRSLTISHHNKLWGGSLNFLSKIQQYQLTRLNTNVYSRLPQIQANYHKPFPDLIKPGFPLNLKLDSEIVNFAQNGKSNSNLPEGFRYHLRPSLQIAYENEYSFFKPQLSLDFLHYQLDEKSHNQDYTRALPIFSIDSGLFFDRQAKLFNQNYTQTFEPRLFYLRVKEKQQNNLPLFDTDQNTFSFSQLFKENRFTGIDRLGDANQIATSVTTRFISPRGRESLRASIGQIWYLKDRIVGLNNLANINPENRSQTALEVSTEFLTHWRSSLSMLYNSNQNSGSFGDRIEQANIRLQYYRDKQHILNLAYIEDTTSKNLSLSNYWEIASNWQMFGAVNYHTEDNYLSDALFGFEYDSCCYAIRLALEHEKDSLTNETNNSIMFRIMFKGLSSLGNLDAKHLSELIPGTQNIF